MEYRLAGISLRQLRYFATVAKTGSFRAASLALRVSQPALTVQLQKLENQLGTKLLVRTSRGVELTLAGSQFLGSTNAALAELDCGVRELSAQSSAMREFRVGLAPTPGRALVADLLSAAALKHIKLNLIDGLSDQLWSGVEAGELDAACCFQVGSTKGLKVINLYKQELVIVGTPDELKRNNEPLPISELRNLSLVLSQREHFTRRWIEEIAQSAGVRLEMIIEAPTALKRNIILKQKRCALVPYDLFNEDLRAGRLIARTLSPAVFRDVVLVLRKDLPASAVNFLISATHAIIAERISEGQLGWRYTEARGNSRPLLRSHNRDTIG